MPKIFVCKNCSKQFTKKSTYVKHTKMKTGCAVCQFCKKKFLYKSSLVRHLKLCDQRVNKNVELENSRIGMKKIEYIDRSTLRIQKRLRTIIQQRFDDIEQYNQTTKRYEEIRNEYYSF